MPNRTCRFAAADDRYPLQHYPIELALLERTRQAPQPGTLASQLSDVTPSAESIFWLVVAKLWSGRTGSSSDVSASARRMGLVERAKRNFAITRCLAPSFVPAARLT